MVKRSLDTMPERRRVSTPSAGENGACTRISAVSPARYSFLSGISVTSSCSTLRAGGWLPPLTQRVSLALVAAALVVVDGRGDAVLAALRGLEGAGHRLRAGLDGALLRRRSRPGVPAAAARYGLVLVLQAGSRHADRPPGDSFAV